jgi:hypothetical protein
VKSNEVDILFGNTKCTPIAKDEDVAFVRCGFPVYNRVGYLRYGFMGYYCGVYLTNRIMNAILEWGIGGDVCKSSLLFIFWCGVGYAIANLPNVLSIYGVAIVESNVPKGKGVSPQSICGVAFF